MGAWLQRHGVERAVFEPTGRYHRRLHQALAARGCETVLVRPDCARRFAEALGQLAKTDRVDAAMLARYGRMEGLTATAPREAAQTALLDLVQLRTRCVNERAAYGKLVAELESGEARRQARLHLQALDRRVTALNEALETALAADPALQRRAEILRSIPGLGPANAASLVAAMPELGRLDRRAAAALLGVAPCANDSGQHQGKRHVRGGRRAPRTLLDMAAVAAIRWNAPLRAFYQRLRARGKEAKVALVAVTRKLVVLANALLQTDRLWQDAPPPRPSPELATQESR